MSICIIGGGLTGCLIALELAEAGKQVVLLEKETRLVSRASLGNEGKIHLGFVYAADPTFRTARRMIDDALAFRPILERWISKADFDTCLYDEFDYLVPHDSMLDVAAIRGHFGAISDYLAGRAQAGAPAYLGQGERPAFVEGKPTRPGTQAEFRTAERGVWPGLIAQYLMPALHTHPAIEVRTSARVSRIAASGRGWQVGIDGETAPSGPFETVVNCAWAERRALDATAGFTDGATWLYRYKFAVLLDNASRMIGGMIPRNSTAMLGSYGDSVYHAAEDILYCSWYPVGMCYSTTRLTSDQRPNTGDLRSAIEGTWQGYAAIDPAYGDVLRGADWRKARLAGDFIAARARTDIDDPASLLHKRNDHGPTELAQGYWTVETGKYTSAARCADECARKILGQA